MVPPLLFNVFTALSKSDSLSFVIVAMASVSEKDINFSPKNLQCSESNMNIKRKIIENFLFIEGFIFYLF